MRNSMSQSELLGWIICGCLYFMLTISLQVWLCRHGKTMLLPHRNKVRCVSMNVQAVNKHKWNTEKSPRARPLWTIDNSINGSNFDLCTWYKKNGHTRPHTQWNGMENKNHKLNNHLVRKFVKIYGHYRLFGLVISLHPEHLLSLVYVLSARIISNTSDTKRDEKKTIQSTTLFFWSLYRTILWLEHRTQACLNIANRRNQKRAA